MYFLKDKKLYTNTDYCLDSLRNLKVQSGLSANSGTLFHAYWYGEFSALQALSVKSFLAMHDLSKVTLYLWIDEENGSSSHLQNPHIVPLLPLITVRKFNPLQEAEGTFLDFELSKNFLLRKRKKALLRDTKKLAYQADIFRTLILHKYGGVYFDLDMLFLRNLQIILDLFPSCEFCYQWSAKSYANTAILKINKESDNSKRIISKSVQLKDFNPRSIYTFDDNKIDMLCFPSSFFDPFWLCFDKKDFSNYAYFHRFSDFFSPMEVQCSLERFYPGAFTYHWHNNWTANDIINSYAGRFNMEIDSILRSKYNIEPNKSFQQTG